MKKVETSMEKEKQQKMWKKRIRTIQVLCMLIIVSFGMSRPYTHPR
jgi:hypothetical protein